jgi:hypothetical protein
MLGTKAQQAQKAASASGKAIKTTQHHALEKQRQRGEQEHELSTRRSGSTDKHGEH